MKKKRETKHLRFFFDIYILYIEYYILICNMLLDHFEFIEKRNGIRMMIGNGKI